MLQLKDLLTMGVIAFSLSSCGPDDGEEMGHSTPIDSTNLYGTAPATYGGDNPANYQDTVLANSSDTGTRISTGPDSMRKNR